MKDWLSYFWGHVQARLIALVQWVSEKSQF